MAQPASTDISPLQERILGLVQVNEAIRSRSRIVPETWSSTDAAIRLVHGPFPHTPWNRLSFAFSRHLSFMGSALSICLCGCSAFVWCRCLQDPQGKTMIIIADTAW